MTVRLSSDPSLLVGDLALQWDPSTGTVDLAVVGDDLASDEGLETAVLLSIFTDARANPDDTLPSDDGDLRGWLGDEFADVEGDRFGSRLWLLSRAARRADVLPLAEQYVTEALAWMVTDGVARSVEVVPEFGTVGGAAALLLGVTVYKPDGTAVGFRFSHVWAEQPSTNRAPTADFSAAVDGLEVAFTDESSDIDGAVVAWLWWFGDGETSTEQHPSHEYAALGSYTVRLTITDDRGTQSFVEQSVEASVPTDGPDGVYVPTTAAHWTALGIPVPTECYACQEASGNLLPSIGTLQLAPGGAGHLYQQTVAGWVRKAVGLTEGTAGNFGTADASLDLAAGDSYYVLLYFRSTLPSAQRRILAANGDNNGARLNNATGTLEQRHNGAATTGAADHADSDVHPILWARDASANTSRTYTDLEQINAVHAEGAVAGQTKCLGGVAGTPPAARFLLAAIWKNPSRALVKADLQALGWTLAY